jgi:hypothetical protein
MVLSNSLYVFYPLVKARGYKKHNSLDKKYRVPNLEKWLTAGVIDRQGMLTFSWHLIPPLIYSEVRVRPFSELYFPIGLTRLNTFRYFCHFIKIDFYPTSCMFSIPSPRLGDRKHTTRWIKKSYPAANHGRSYIYIMMFISSSNLNTKKKKTFIFKRTTSTSQ